MYFILSLPIDPESIEELTALRMMINDIVDIRTKLGMTFYSPDFVGLCCLTLNIITRSVFELWLIIFLQDNLKAEMMQYLDERLDYYNTYLGDKKWLIGEKVSLSTSIHLELVRILSDL